jgi:hypothetical protein
MKEIEYFDDDGRTTVDFNVDFFFGENEDRLFATTVASLRNDEELSKFISALNDYADENAAQTVGIERFELDGCEDIRVIFKDGSEIKADNETTFGEFLDLILEE